LTPVGDEALGDSGDQIYFGRSVTQKDDANRWLPVGKDPFSKVTVFGDQHAIHRPSAGEYLTVRGTRAFLSNGTNRKSRLPQATDEARVDAFVGEQVNRQ
jgi:hypothetical protein